MSRWCETVWRTCTNSLKSLGAYGRIIEWRAWRSRSASERYRAGEVMPDAWSARIANRPPQDRLGA
jgi:hypothetical protein